MTQNNHSDTVTQFSKSAGTGKKEPAYAARNATNDNLGSSHIITPRTAGQEEFWNNLKDDGNKLSFGLGPAGSGKTFIAVAKAVQALARDDYSKIILTRPAVEAGEKLGSLPGDADEKTAPFLQPLRDAIIEIAGGKYLEAKEKAGVINVVPVAFMRGRSFKNALVLLDEAQNCTYEQIKMVATRLGENSGLIITGDHTQCDLPRAQAGGLNRFVKAQQLNPKAISFAFMTAADIVRSPIVKTVIENCMAYEEQHNDNTNIPQIG